PRRPGDRPARDERGRSGAGRPAAPPAGPRRADPGAVPALDLGRAARRLRLLVRAAAAGLDADQGEPAGDAQADVGRAHALAALRQPDRGRGGPPPQLRDRHGGDGLLARLAVDPELLARADPARDLRRAPALVRGLR